MVQEANVKRINQEKLLKEANAKVSTVLSGFLLKYSSRVMLILLTPF